MSKIDPFENYCKNSPDAVKADDFKHMNEEELRQGLAYWINLANFRGNGLIGLHWENKQMKEDFFKLRKDAFLSRLDRWEVMCMAVKHVGNQPRKEK